MNGEEQAVVKLYINCFKKRKERKSFSSDRQSPLHLYEINFFHSMNPNVLILLEVTHKIHSFLETCKI